ncbi:unnamed protein product [Taenia asiatica]|uniref:Uncharacterized protein n=1 Tax=Taenia asiatica TaxID=60517 RepID=A0A0R3VTW8_TAEAS|nr:unnamed protein product [Taenia asiatica]
MNKCLFFTQLSTLFLPLCLKSTLFFAFLGMNSDVAVCSVVLLCLLVIHRSLQGEVSNMKVNIEQQRKGANVGIRGKFGNVLRKGYLGFEEKAFFTPSESKLFTTLFLRIPIKEVKFLNQELGHL